MGKSIKSSFNSYRKNTIGYNQTFLTPYGKKQIRYFDWTASGRLYKPIEEKMTDTFGPFVGNTHSESSETGMAMTRAYKKAQEIIKKHVHATDSDILLFCGTGTTDAISKLQRILGLKYTDQMHRYEALIKTPQRPCTGAKPIVFITHMEHHSNHTSWEETNADVVIVPPDRNGNVSVKNLEILLKRYQQRKIKIGAFSACSNVSGRFSPLKELARLMHTHNGYCFADFAAAAPYVSLDMHPKNPLERLDAIYFSPHKFLGGPGSSGVLIFNKTLYPANLPPEIPGGGTVNWTNPWGGKGYIEDIFLREDGGTPGFLQAIRAALAIQLKEQMGITAMQEKEHKLLTMLLQGLQTIPNLIMLDHTNTRLGIVSFTIQDIHYNLLVKLLNDRFGIQTRGGCSCAGTYGHYLFHIPKKKSKEITNLIDRCDQSQKPGWVRISLHPTLLKTDITFLINAIKEISQNIHVWEKDYVYDKKTNEFTHKNQPKKLIEKWFL